MMNTITELNLQTLTELSKQPITATLSFLDFPYIALTQNDGYLIGTLWLDVDNFITVEMANATAWREALAIMAYHQQHTTAPLLINDELETAVKYFSDTPNGICDFINQQGKTITIEMMSKQNREQEDLKQLKLRGEI
ncbi:MULTISPECIES: hypothetical protein [unclassified Lonepinella]|uniref:hypothetical protein n=1 Tax=unclassified Lonepinella TaxID=2642006 RepID=UPI0036DA2E90